MKIIRDPGNKQEPSTGSGCLVQSQRLHIYLHFPCFFMLSPALLAIQNQIRNIQQLIHLVKLGAPGKQCALIRLNFSDGANLHNCKAPFSREKVVKRRVCEAETDWERHASAAANSSARLFQLLPSCLSHSTDTAGLRLPPHDTKAVPAAQLKRLPQNEVNSAHVLR